ncbi:MAG: hypothetical protein WBB01_23115 [Phormidesmis sp.]
MSNHTTADLKASLGLNQADRKVVAACAGWAVVSAVGFILYGVLLSKIRPDWFPTVAGLLKLGAFLIAAALCWRNARDRLILSGQSVWQAIALGMTCYALGDITVMVWRSVWGITSAVSLGDAFYGASYLFLAIGLSQAVLPRQTHLRPSQSIGIAAVGIVGIVLACWLNFYAPSFSGVPSAEVTAARVDAVKVGQKEAAIGVIARAENRAPAIVQLIDQRLSRVSDKIGLLYVVGDCVLIVMAAALLMAFWGGTYSAAWKPIALAGLCLYIADMFFIYDVGRGVYTQGSPWEIFWVLSALLFGLGADIERGVSMKMQRHRVRQQRI